MTQKEKFSLDEMERKLGKAKRDLVSAHTALQNSETETKNTQDELDYANELLAKAECELADIHALNVKWSEEVTLTHALRHKAERELAEARAEIEAAKASFDDAEAALQQEHKERDRLREDCDHAKRQAEKYDRQQWRVLPEEGNGGGETWEQAFAGLCRDYALWTLGSDPLLGTREERRDAGDRLDEIATKALAGGEGA